MPDDSGTGNRNTIGLITALPLLAGGIGLLIGSPSWPPPNALVSVDRQRRAILSPPCLKDGEKRTLEEMTFDEARKKNFELDDDCRNNGGFVQEGRSVTGSYLEKLGILKPLPSRWKADGSWNW